MTAEVKGFAFVLAAAWFVSVGASCHRHGPAPAPKQLIAAVADDPDPEPQAPPIDADVTAWAGWVGAHQDWLTRKELAKVDAPGYVVPADYSDPQLEDVQADQDHQFKRYRLDFYAADDTLLHTAFVDAARLDLELRIQSLYWCAVKGSSATVTIYNQVADQWESPAGAALDGPLAYPVEITAHVGNSNK